MIWWINDPARAQAERSAVSDLQDKCPWLQKVSWRLLGLDLVVDFEIHLSERVVPLNMTYPGFFPDVPPQIRSSDLQALSAHQYGAAGELCLEWRPDNWNAEVTGAMMIESALRLLRGEAGEIQGEEVRSAHNVTDGQRVRSSTVRLLVDQEALGVMQELLAWETESFSFAESQYGGTYTAYLTRIGSPDSPVWKKAPPYRQNSAYEGIAVRLQSGQSFPGPITRELLTLTLLLANIEEPTPTATDPRSVLLVDDNTAWLAMLLRIKNDTVVVGYQSLTIPSSEVRLSAETQVLPSKRVGIVGCGSLGSKVATSLARSGVLSFVLIDDDVLLPGNIVRHDLDWRAIGLNKVVGVKIRILEIAPSADIDMRQVRLGGQESSESTSAALKALSECDLIIDATADATVFNLCSAVARRHSRPMAWAKVYAGGIGGIVARVRPGRDPAPGVARNQLSSWWEQRSPDRPPGEAVDYGIRLDEGPPLIANDGDVCVIAAHLTRLAVDTLARPDDSSFQHSAYAVGMAKASIFVGPFDTYPISFSGSEGWGPSDPGLDEEGVLAFLDDILTPAE